MQDEGLGRPPRFGHGAELSLLQPQELLEATRLRGPSGIFPSSLLIILSAQTRLDGSPKVSLDFRVASPLGESCKEAGRMTQPPKP